MTRAFQTHVAKLFHSVKYADYPDFPLILPVRNHAGQHICLLEAVTAHHISDHSVISCLASWRKAQEQWFPAQFRVTLAGTRRWTHRQLLAAPDRILFLIRLFDGVYIGHVGLYRFDFAQKSCEIDNVIRGANDVPGIMTLALKTLILWAKQVLGVQTLYLRVFADNTRAIALYKRCGFHAVKKIPLRNVHEENIVKWVEILPGENYKHERYFTQMKLAFR